MTGVLKSQAAPLPEDLILYSGACYLWVFVTVLYATFLAPVSLTWVLDFWKLCVALVHITKSYIVCVRLVTKS